MSAPLAVLTAVTLRSIELCQGIADPGRDVLWVLRSVLFVLHPTREPSWDDVKRAVARPRPLLLRIQRIDARWLGDAAKARLKVVNDRYSGEEKEVRPVVEFVLWMKMLYRAIAARTQRAPRTPRGGRSTRGTSHTPAQKRLPGTAPVARNSPQHAAGSAAARLQANVPSAVTSLSVVYDDAPEGVRLGAAVHGDEVTLADSEGLRVDRPFRYDRCYTMRLRRGAADGHTPLSVNEGTCAHLLDAVHAGNSAFLCVAGTSGGMARYLGGGDGCMAHCVARLTRDGARAVHMSVVCLHDAQCSDLLRGGAAICPGADGEGVLTAATQRVQHPADIDMALLLRRASHPDADGERRHPQHVLVTLTPPCTANVPHHPPSLHVILFDVHDDHGMNAVRDWARHARDVPDPHAAATDGAAARSHFGLNGSVHFVCVWSTGEVVNSPEPAASDAWRTLQRSLHFTHTQDGGEVHPWVPGGTPATPRLDVQDAHAHGEVSGKGHEGGGEENASTDEPLAAANDAIASLKRAMLLQLRSTRPSVPVQSAAEAVLAIIGRDAAAGWAATAAELCDVGFTRRLLHHQRAVHLPWAAYRRLQNKIGRCAAWLRALAERPEENPHGDSPQALVCGDALARWAVAAFDEFVTCTDGGTMGPAKNPQRVGVGHRDRTQSPACDANAAALAPVLQREASASAPSVGSTASSDVAVLQERVESMQSALDAKDRELELLRAASTSTGHAPSLPSPQRPTVVVPHPSSQLPPAEATQPSPRPSPSPATKAQRRQRREEAHRQKQEALRLHAWRELVRVSRRELSEEDLLQASRERLLRVISMYRLDVHPLVAARVEMYWLEARARRGATGDGEAALLSAAAAASVAVASCSSSDATSHRRRGRDLEGTPTVCGVAQPHTRAASGRASKARGRTAHAPAAVVEAPRSAGCSGGSLTTDSKEPSPGSSLPPDLMNPEMGCAGDMAPSPQASPAVMSPAALSPGVASSSQDINIRMFTCGETSAGPARTSRKLEMMMEDL